MKTPPDITLDQIRPIIRGLGTFDAVALTPLRGGSTKVWRIDLAKGDPLVLKTYPEGMGWAPAKEAYAARLLRDFPLPVTRYLLVDDTKAKVPVSFAMANYLPGKPLRDLKSEPDIKDAYRQMGALIRHLHDTQFDAYGYIGHEGIIHPQPNHTAHMRERVDEAFRQFRHFGADAVLADRLERIVEERFAIFTHSNGAVFAHDDVQQGNVLAVRGTDGRLELTGLIDFGNVRAADPVYDFAKCLFCAESEDPRCRAPMLEGYGPLPHPRPEEAMWLYTLFHRMSMWWWLRFVNAIPTAAEPHGIIDDLRKMVDEV
jgi:Ser/Thr protein kinase RdoA (MazF antagonist)